MNNLERLVCAMGFERINPESLTAIRDFVGDPPNSPPSPPSTVGRR